MSEIKKKGFYKWNPITKKFELIVQSEQNTWILTNTFQDVEGKPNLLYILPSDCTVDGKEYKKGFYTYDPELEDFVLQSGSSEVFTDIDGDHDLPIDNINNQTIYRKEKYTYTHNSEELSDIPVGYKILDTENIQISQESITIDGTETSWMDVTLETINGLLDNNRIELSGFNDSNFFKYNDNLFDIAGNFEEETSYTLFFNPTKTQEGYIKIGGVITDDVLLKNPVEESLSEEAVYQNQVNKEFKEKLRNIGEFVNVGNSFDNVDKNEKYLYYLEEDWEKPDEHNDFLCFTSNQDGSTVGYNIENREQFRGQIMFSYNKNNWENWDGNDITLDKDRMVFIKNDNNKLSENDVTFRFTMSGSIAASGNVMSLLNYDNVKADCFRNLFEDCTALTTAPDLPAITLANFCYYHMFAFCSSLTTAPDLPATTLAYSCYNGMFSGCTALTTAPNLPATTLAEYCYQSMFSNCTALTTAPNLPATTLAEYCYSRMFEYCSNLSTIKLLYTDNFSENIFFRWVSYVETSGTLYYNGSDTTRGVSAIPEGWTVEQFS